MQRNTASHYLNQLVAQDVLVKINTRPVYFLHKAAFSQPIDLFAIQPGEELLLSLRIQAVDFIEKQHAAVCRFKRPGFCRC